MIPIGFFEYFIKTLNIVIIFHKKRFIIVKNKHILDKHEKYTHPSSYTSAPNICTMQSAAVSAF